MTAPHQRPEPSSQGMARVLRDAALIVAACSLLALAVNVVHPRGIPLVATQDYEILVPCPEPGGEVTAVAPTDLLLGADTTFVVDARDPAEAESWRFREAMNVPYDYLDPTPPEVLREVARSIARSRARHLLVYGDGDRPDSGEQLAREIAASGIKNVGFVRGGAPALRQHHGGGDGP